jgi:hypothetical protein
MDPEDGRPSLQRFYAPDSLPLDPILSQMNPVHIITPYIFKIHVNILQSMSKSLKWFSD